MDQNNNETWTRPENIPYPSVWCKFDGRREINGVMPKFWIQDIPEDQYGEIAKYMTTHFIDDEPISASAKISSCKQSVEEMYLIWEDVLKDKVGLVCYMENPNKDGEPIIAGINCTFISHKHNKKLYVVKGEAGAKFFNVTNYVEGIKNVYEELSADTLLDAMGLYVFPQFRGQTLGAKLLQAREPLCRALGIKGTITAFTATVSQILAEKAGFQLLIEVPYKDLNKVDPTFVFPGLENHTKALKHMYKMYY